MFDPLSAALVLGVTAAVHRGARRASERQALQRRDRQLLNTQLREQERYRQARLELHQHISDAFRDAGRSTFQG